MPKKIVPYSHLNMFLYKYYKLLREDVLSSKLMPASYFNALSIFQDKIISAWDKIKPFPDKKFCLQLKSHSSSFPQANMKFLTLELRIDSHYLFYNNNWYFQQIIAVLSTSLSSIKIEGVTLVIFYSFNFSEQSFSLKLDSTEPKKGCRSDSKISVKENVLDKSFVCNEKLSIIFKRLALIWTFFLSRKK